VVLLLLLDLLLLLLLLVAPLTRPPAVLLAGYLPFEEDSMPLLFDKIERADFAMPEWIGQPAADLIRQILQPDPEKRLTIAQIAGHPWMQAQGGEEAWSLEPEDPDLLASKMSRVNSSVPSDLKVVGAGDLSRSSSQSGYLTSQSSQMRLDMLGMDRIGEGSGQSLGGSQGRGSHASAPSLIRNSTSAASGGGGGYVEAGMTSSLDAEAGTASTAAASSLDAKDPRPEKVTPWPGLRLLILKRSLLLTLK